MAEVKIHRGLDQIGGCITEISTDTSRVFIDFGQNLPGNGEPTTPEEDEKLVSSIFASNPKEHEAVFYTHGHEDHVGLFEYIPDNVPQFMSEGTKALLSIKYDVLYEGAKLKVEELQTKECEEKEYSEAINSLVNADNKQHYRLTNSPKLAPTVFLEACTSKERNYEITIGKKEYGSLSYMVYLTLKNSKIGSNPASFENAVKSTIANSQEWQKQLSGKQHIVTETSY